MNEQRKIEVEEVASVAAPPRARVGDAEADTSKLARKRDYLEGFLTAKPEAPATGGAGSELQAAIVEELKQIFDPEIPVNIYDLGLIYDVRVTDDGHATVLMTLTTPNCPVAESMPAEVELRVAGVPGVGIADVELVWDPPWDPQKMSDDAKLELGML